MPKWGKKLMRAESCLMRVLVDSKDYHKLGWNEKNSDCLSWKIWACLKFMRVHESWQEYVGFSGKQRREFELSYALIFIFPGFQNSEPLPGPTPSTVLDPGAICVLPASLIRHVSKPRDLPFLVRSTLWARQEINTIKKLIINHVLIIYNKIGLQPCPMVNKGMQIGGEKLAQTS